MAERESDDFGFVLEHFPAGNSESAKEQILSKDSNHKKKGFDA